MKHSLIIALALISLNCFGQVEIYSQDDSLFHFFNKWVKVGGSEYADSITDNVYKSPIITDSAGVVFFDGNDEIMIDANGDTGIVLPKQRMFIDDTIDSSVIAKYPSTEKGLILLSDFLFDEFDLLKKYYLKVDGIEDMVMIINKMGENIEKQKTVIQLLKKYQ